MIQRPPPWLVRRFVIAPAVVAGAIVAVGSLPIWLIVAAFASRYLPGRWRGLRVAWFLFFYLVVEALLLVVLFGTWVFSGFGWKLRSPRFVDLHYRLTGWFLRRVIGSARRTFHVRIESTAAAGEPMPSPDRPAIVLCRHAGPGDSLLLIDAVLNERGRRPRIVLKDLLRFDPCVDVVLSRLPNRFVPSSGGAGQQAVDAIAELAGTMGPSDALVIFPEGGNFTAGRHARAVAKLEEIERPDLAERARSMRHVLPPRSAGALAAIAAAPSADVVFVGHVGLERLVTVADVWRGIPMDTSVIAATWRIAADEVPPADERETWLYDRWAMIDDWIDERIDVRIDERATRSGAAGASGPGGEA